MKRKFCAICKINEYSNSNEQLHWICCKICNAGWCCSEKHWKKYKRKHTAQICHSYKQSSTMELFQWNHMKNTMKTLNSSHQKLCHIDGPPFQVLGMNTSYFDSRKCILWVISKDEYPQSYFLVQRGFYRKVIAFKTHKCHIYLSSLISDTLFMQLTSTLFLFYFTRITSNCPIRHV